MHVRPSVVAAQAARGDADCTPELRTRETCHRADELGIFSGRAALIWRVGAVIAEPPTPEEVTLTIAA
jgi:hypothetical protein